MEAYGGRIFYASSKLYTELYLPTYLLVGTSTISKTTQKQASTPNFLTVLINENVANVTNFPTKVSPRENDAVNYGYKASAKTPPNK